VAAARLEQDFSLDSRADQRDSRSLKAGKFLQRIDIVKRALVRKGDFDRLVARVPRANLAFTGVQKGR
jgi:hypothetical protein